MCSAVPAAKTGSSSNMLQAVFDFIGVKNVSTKIIGAKRRNRHMVIQALFDAFNHHSPPEDVAFRRGLRMQWLGTDR
jgi:ribosomal protein S5